MKLLFLTISLIFALICNTGLQARGEVRLPEIHQTIQNKFGQLKHLRASQFTLLDRDNLIIFDVREAEEFDVSHLDGAIRVSPDISQKDFINNFAELTQGKTMVFYCSVGYRSSALAAQILKNFPSNEIYNLQGGIFNWHNERRNLVNENGASEDIHPYDQYWGRLLERPENIRYPGTQ